MSGWGRAGHRWHSPDSAKIPLETYAEWSRAHAFLNAAILPATIDATVVDVDDPAQLEAVLDACGPTPFRTYSGREGGGVHLWYRGASRSRNAIAPGVDVKSIGGYVLAPGAIHHVTGAPYTASPELAAGLAAGALELPAPHADWRQRLGRLGARMTNPSRLDLSILADTLRGRDATREIARRLAAVAKGEPFAEPGERDSALYHCLRVLTEHWPRATEASIVALFAPSAAVMEAAHPVEIPIVEAVATKWERLTREAADAEDAADDRDREVRRRAWAWVRIDSDETADPSSAPVVVHAGRSYFVRVGDEFAGPWIREELTPDVLRSLGAVYDVALPDVPALLAGYGARAADVRHSLAERQTRWDPTTSVLHVATAPIRADLAPEFSPAVDALLGEIGGPYAQQLRWWLVGLLRSDVPCRALVLSGKRGRGKSLLLDGIGRLWPHGAAKMRDVLGKRFNASLTRAGLAVADDDTSAAEAGGALASFLRESVNDRVQRLERKHHDVATVDGCMRYAVATNDPFDLVRGAVSYNLNHESLEAFGDRLLHVPVPDEAAGCWERAGVTGEQLVAGDMIARHVLALAELGRGVGASPFDRFWVGAGDTELARLAVLSSGLRADLLVHIATALETPGQKPPWLAVDAERVVVHPAGLAQTWMDAPRGATRRSIGMACKALAEASTCEPVAHTGGPRRYAIDLALVQWFAERAGV